jgi:hypothetical protein
MICIEELADGTMRSAAAEDCIDQSACIVNGVAEPIDKCDNVTGYNPKDLERVLTWGRRNCK